MYGPGQYGVDGMTDGRESVKSSGKDSPRDSVVLSLNILGVIGN